MVWSMTARLALMKGRYRAASVGKGVDICDIEIAACFGVCYDKRFIINIATRKKDAPTNGTVGRIMVAKAKTQVVLMVEGRPDCRLLASEYFVEVVRQASKRKPAYIWVR